jgi:pyridoxal phosphate enzyme (YggS family)
MTGVEQGRRDELAATLARVRARIAAACAAAGRDPAQVRLLPVTKTFPARDVALLVDLGLLDAAEARDAEAVPKVAEVAALRAVVVRWHMVGRLQRNKCPSVARWAAQIQSVDSVRLVEALHRAVGSAMQAGRRQSALGVLVQASLDGDPARGGCPLPELQELADRVAAASPQLRLEGVMGVAPLGMDPGAAFAQLGVAAQRLRRSHPAAVELSAGMSGDLEQAIEHGSTCVRVGTALLGDRPLISR